MFRVLCGASVVPLGAARSSTGVMIDAVRRERCQTLDMPSTAIPSSSFCDLGVGCSATHFFRHSLCCLDGLMMTTMLRQRRQYAGSDSIADARNAFIPFALVCVLTRGKRLMGLGLRNRVTYSVPIPFRGTQMSSNSIPLSSSEWRRRDNSHCLE